MSRATVPASSLRTKKDSKALWTQAAFSFWGLFSHLTSPLIYEKRIKVQVSVGLHPAMSDPGSENGLESSVGVYSVSCDWLG